jgi:hypothetical protein
VAGRLFSLEFKKKRTFLFRTGKQLLGGAIVAPRNLRILRMKNPHVYIVHSSVVYVSWVEINPISRYICMKTTYM